MCMYPLDPLDIPHNIPLRSCWPERLVKNPLQGVAEVPIKMVPASKGHYPSGPRATICCWVPTIKIYGPWLCTPSINQLYSLLRLCFLKHMVLLTPKYMLPALGFVNFPWILHNSFLESLLWRLLWQWPPSQPTESNTLLYNYRTWISLTPSTYIYWLWYLTRCEIFHLLTNLIHPIKPSIVTRSSMSFLVLLAPNNDFHSSGAQEIFIEWVGAIMKRI